MSSITLSIPAPSLIRRETFKDLLPNGGFLNNSRVNNVPINRKIKAERTLYDPSRFAPGFGQGNPASIPFPKKDIVPAQRPFPIELGPVGPSRPKIVLFGSSIVQYSFCHNGWGANLADIYARKADVIVRGYAAWNSRRALGVIDQVFPKKALSHPDLIITYCGGNDSQAPHGSGMGPHVPLDEYIENMTKIINHLKSLSDTTRLIFLSCPPVKDQEEVGQNLTRRKYAEALVKLCTDQNLKVIDLVSAIYSVENWKDTCYIHDGVHFTAKASEKVTLEILKVLKDSDWGLHWSSLPTEFCEDSPYYPVYGDTTYNVSDVTDYRGRTWI